MHPIDLLSQGIDLGSVLCTQVLRTASVADFLQTGNLYDDQFVPHNITLCADPKP